MHREGTRIGAAVTIMLLSCLGTMIALLCLNLYALLAGVIDGSSQTLRAALWTSTGIATVMVLLAVPPGPFQLASAAITRSLRRLLGGRDAIPVWPRWSRTAPALVRVDRLARKLGDLLEAYRHDTGRFLRHGKAAFALVLALSLTFIMSRAVVAYLVVRFMGLDGSTFRHILEAQVVVLLVEFVAPTPGGAGVVEGASLALMAAIVPPGYAPHYTLLWRLVTLYLPALAGFVCLARALLEDTRRLVRPDAAKLTWPRSHPGRQGSGHSVTTRRHEIRKEPCDGRAVGRKLQVHGGAACDLVGGGSPHGDRPGPGCDQG